MTQCEAEVDPVVVALRAERIRRGWTLRQVAELAGCAFSSIHHAEVGKRSPTLALLRAWADALGMDLATVPRAARRTWGAWAEAAGRTLADPGVDPATVPDPPTREDQHE